MKYKRVVSKSVGKVHEEANVMGQSNSMVQNADSKGGDLRKKNAKTTILLGSSLTISIFLIFVQMLGSYRSFWSLMIEGIIIGLIIGSVVGVAGSKVSTNNQKRSRYGLGFALVVASLIGGFFTALFSFLSWQEGYLQPEIFLPLIFGSFGFIAGFLLAYGLTQRFMTTKS